MTSEEVHAHLITGLNKSFINSIIPAIHDKPEVVGDILKTALEGKGTPKKKAAWVVRQLAIAKPKSISPHLKKLVDGLEIERDSSVLRDLLKALTIVELSDDLTGKAVDRAFALLSGGKYAVAVKYLSMQFLEQQCDRWPELKTELAEAVISQRNLHTDTYKRHADKLLRRLEQ